MLFNKYNIPAHFYASDFDTKTEKANSAKEKSGTGKANSRNE
ncbi:hypothetical protein [Flavobacterium panici]|nr:hypothetical protein [Flavobacterium panici]